MDCESPERPLPNFLANVYRQNHPKMKTLVRDSFGMGQFVNGTTQGARCAQVFGYRDDPGPWIQG